MKRFLILISAALLAAFSANAQDHSFGLKAGVNMSGNILKNMDGKTSMKPGFEVGGFWKYDVNKYFAIQPELLFSMQNSDYKLSGVTQKYMNWDLNIPIYALGQLPVKNGDRAYLGIGPDLSLGMAGKDRISGENIYKKDGLMSRFDVGAAVLLGYEFKFGMQINLGYRYGFFNALQNPAPDASMTRHCATLGIGYRF